MNNTPTPILGFPKVLLSKLSLEAPGGGGRHLVEIKLFNLFFCQHFNLVVLTADALVLSEVVYAAVEYDSLIFDLKSCT